MTAHDDTPTAATHGRGKNGQFIRSLTTADRDALAARLRATGMGYREIAARLGLETAGAAHRAVARALKAVPVEDVTELRAIECERLDALSQRLWTILDTRIPLGLARGQRIVDQNNEPVQDPAPVLAVVDRLLRITEKRSRLLGLDQAQKPEPQPQTPALALVEQLLTALLQGSEQQAIGAAPVRGLPALPTGERADGA